MLKTKRIDSNACPLSSTFQTFCNVDLCFDFVLSLEHLVDFCQVVGPFGYSLRVTPGRVTFLQMCLFPKRAHLPHR